LGELKVRQILIDLSAIAGVALISFGAWLAWPPAGFLVAGALILAGALASGRQ
jgi:hypothetical protein